jgi:inosine-uridine nucleoside N-ribohydrolase
MIQRVMAATALCALAAASIGQARAPQSPRIKVIADQDSAGPQGTNFLSLLMLLNAPGVDLLGITTGSGDQWVDPATIFALYALELTGRTDVPVVKGARMPLVNSAREQELREALYGSHSTWHGAFNPDTPPPTTVWPPPGGYPKTKVRPGYAATFLIETIRAHPNEVVLYLAGPLTNLALAVRMDPEIVPLVKSLHIMGASSSGGFELNWWWDPEAAAIVMREPWREIVVTTGEAGAQVFSSEALMKRVADSKGRLARYVREQYLDYKPGPGTTLWSAMWDEISVAALVDPSVVKRSESMYLDVDITHGPKYGHTVVWRKPSDIPSFFLPYSGPEGVDRGKWLGHLESLPGRTPATVYMDVDAERFEHVFVDLMTR